MLCGRNGILHHKTCDWPRSTDQSSDFGDNGISPGLGTRERFANYHCHSWELRYSHVG